MRRLLVLSLVTACARRDVVTYPRDLAGATSELRAHGSADVRGFEREDEVAYGQSVVHVRLDDRVDVRLDDREQHVTVGEVLAGCPDGRFAVDDAARQRYPHCPLVRSADPITLSHARHPNTSTLAWGAALGGAVGLGVCTFECSSPWSYMSGATLVTGVAIAIGFGVFIYAVSRDD